MSELSTPKKHEVATFACGCFWGVEAAFRKVAGVVDSQVGYTGGTTEHPTYEQVCSGTTGHVEAVRLLYDESRVSYEELLRGFSGLRDSHAQPSKPQYRSVIFYHSEAQRRIAEKFAPHGVEIRPAGRFWVAEEYHQRYLDKHPDSC